MKKEYKLMKILNIKEDELKLCLIVIFILLFGIVVGGWLKYNGVMLSGCF